MYTKISLLCFFVGVLISNVFAADLCDICQCSPGKENPLLVNCNSKYETLTVSGGKMLKMHRIKHITFNNFKTLSFERNAFSPVNALEWLAISNCKQVVFPEASLTSVMNINITNVNDLMLTSNASIAVHNLQNLYLTNVNITNLPERAIYNLYDLKNVVIDHVYIKRIESRAIDITMDERNGKISIINTIVDNVEKSGINLNSYEIHIDNTQFHSIKEAGVSLESKYNVNIRECVFNKLQPDFITIASPNISFVNNSFVQTEISLFNGIIFDNEIINSTTFEFENNIVEDMSIFETQRQLTKVHSNINDNKILYCNCDNDFDSLLTHTKNEDSLKHNYCLGVCEVTIYDFLRNKNDFCNKYSNSRGFLDIERLCFRQENSSEIPEFLNRTTADYEISFTSESTFINSSGIKTTESIFVPKSNAHTVFNISLNLGLFYLLLGILCCF